MIRFALLVMVAMVAGTLAFADDAQAFNHQGRAGCSAASSCSGASHDDGWYFGKRRQERRADRQARRAERYAANHGCSGEVYAPASCSETVNCDGPVTPPLTYDPENQVWGYAAPPAPPVLDCPNGVCPPAPRT